MSQRIMLLKFNALPIHKTQYLLYMRYIQRVYNHFRAYHFAIISNILKYNKYGYIFASLHFAKVLIACRATTFGKVD